MSEKRRIVLDTNCLIASLSRHSVYYPVWSGFQMGKYILCVSNDILEEYQEIIEQKTSAVVARNVIDLLLKSKNVDYITPHFKFGLITLTMMMTSLWTALLRQMLPILYPMTVILMSSKISNSLNYWC